MRGQGPDQPALRLRRLTPRARPLEQLALELGPERPRWSFSRLVLRSPHYDRILARLEFVRRFFPEIEGSTIRIGLAKKRGVLGWGSLDPERPGVWVRPRRLEYFTVAHEFTHLLQARRIVPLGERACDLWALTRSPLLIDCFPSYLKLPGSLRRHPRPSLRDATLLHEWARHAIEARERGDRRYLSGFEREVARALDLRDRDGGAHPDAGPDTIGDVEPAGAGCDARRTPAARGRSK